MNNKETAKELLLKADELISEAKELLAQTENNSDEDPKDIIEDWSNTVRNNDCYFLNPSDNPQVLLGGHYYLWNEQNPYCMYATETYALMSQKMKMLNDKLLAFKWCYDREYQPDWTDRTINKYFVVYDYIDDQYNVVNVVTWFFNTVYFSSREIAQKCADWLNSMKEKENEHEST